MQIDRSEGRCRECGGVLQIVGVDDCSLDVECLECGETYGVELSALGDGYLAQFVPFLADQQEVCRDE